MREEKVVLITGCSRGIGFETSLCLAKQGYCVFATVKSLHNAKKLLTHSNENPNLIVRKMDITKQHEIDLVIHEIIRTKGKIDIAINNAAHILFGPVETCSLTQIKKQFNVNLFGGIRVVQSILPYMREKAKGHIIFMGSTSGIQCSAMYGVYAATKYALEAIAYSLAITSFPWKIKISIIENSATTTELTSTSLELGNRLKGQNPYKSYTSNSLSFLRAIVKQGQSPKDVAKFILTVIKRKVTALRCAGTTYAQEVLDNTLKNPTASYWLDVAKKELNWFK